jgi:hypothetical protein
MRSRSLGPNVQHIRPYGETASGGHRPLAQSVGALGFRQDQQRRTPRPGSPRCGIPRLKAHTAARRPNPISRVFEKLADAVAHFNRVRQAYHDGREVAAI